MFGFPAVDGIALNGETLQLPALLAGAALGALAMRSPPGTKRRRLRLLLAGVLLGSAIAVKPSAGLHPLPMLVWLAIDAAKRTHARRVATLDALIFVLSVVLVPAAFLAHAAAQGTLASLLYYCVTYNLAVHKNASPDLFPGLGPLYDHLRGHTLYFVLTLGAFASVVPFALRRIAAAARSRSLRALGRGFGARHYLALHAIAALALASSLPQHFAHYYVPATPFLALCAAASVDRLFRVRATARGARRAAILAASFVAFSCGAFAYVTALAGGRVTHDVTVERAARYVEAHSRPDDKIFVWGFSPWIYGYSHRRPAGRYLFHTYVTGFVPLFWWALDSEPKRVVPGSMEALLGDLDREKPELVVDAGSLMIARPMRAYAPAAAWLHMGFCFEARVGAFDVYRRKHGATCDVPWFPCQHPTLDHWGRPLGVLTPPIVDLAESRRLPETGNDEPHGFDPTSTPATCAP